MAFAAARNAKFAGLTGDPLFYDIAIAATPGSAQTLIDETVPAGKKWTLSQLELNGVFDARITVTINTALVGSGTIGSGAHNLFFSWFPGRPMAATENVRVILEQVTETPAAIVRAHLQLTEESI